MENNMNKPVEYNWEPDDIIEEYRKYQDKKKVAKIYGITSKEVTQIIKENCYE